MNGLRVQAALDDRKMCRQEVVKEMFAVQLAPLLHTLASIFPVSKAVLWENIMVRIAPLYSSRTEESDQERQRLQADFVYLTQIAPRDLLGERRNPLTRFTEDKAVPPVAKSKRITCCFYYQMLGEYCIRCPKIDSENNSQTVTFLPLLREYKQTELVTLVRLAEDAIVRR
nr:IucA/IucC family C-terminal-domain containing protein [Paenibacillus sp. EKM211P]